MSGQGEIGATTASTLAEHPTDKASAESATESPNKESIESAVDDPNTAGGSAITNEAEMAQVGEDVGDGGSSRIDQAQAEPAEDDQAMMQNLFAASQGGDPISQWMAESSGANLNDSKQQLAAAALASGNMQFLGTQYKGDHYDPSIAGGAAVGPAEGADPMLGGELQAQQAAYAVDVASGGGAAAAAGQGESTVAQAWTTGMPVEGSLLPTANQTGTGAGAAGEMGEEGEGEDSGDSSSSGDEDDEDDDDSDDDEDSDEDEDEESEEEEDALNPDDWMEVESGAAYERSIAGWDVYRYALDGVQTAFFYQNQQTGESTWSIPPEVVRADAEAQALEKHLQALNPYRYEGLDQDDDPKPWVPPTVRKAEKARAHSVFSKGTADYCGVRHDDLNQLGVGVSLYFRLLWMLSLLFLGLTVLYIPAFLVFSNGNRIPGTAADSVSFSSLTLGNAGNRLALRAEVDALGRTVEVAPGNETFVTIGNNGDLTGYEATYMVSGFDFAVSVVFIAFIFIYSRRIRDVASAAEKRLVSAADYSVLVKGLPADATEDEVRQFFSDRFGLYDMSVSESTGYEGAEKGDDMAARAANFAGALRQNTQAQKTKKAVQAIGRMRMLAHVHTRQDDGAAAAAVRLKTGRGALVGSTKKGGGKDKRMSLYKQQGAATSTRGKSKGFDFDQVADLAEGGGAAGAAVALDVEELNGDDNEAVDATTGSQPKSTTSGYIKVAQTPKASSRHVVENDVADFVPVMDVTHNRKLEYIGSWCADVVMIRDKTKGDRIRAYLAVQEAVERLREARARAKMFRSDTPLGTGPDKARREEAEQEVTQLAADLEMVRVQFGDAIRASAKDHKTKEELAMEAAMKYGQQQQGDGEAAQVAGDSQGDGPDEELTDPAYGAFVTFAHEESFLRCMEQYRFSKYWWGSLFQDPTLQFRDTHRISVQPSPDPSDVLWENVTTPFTERCWRRVLTGCIMIALLIVSFVLILLATIAYGEYQDLVPDLSMCETELPALTFGSYDNVSTATAAVQISGQSSSTSAGSIALQRPAGAIERSEGDQNCGGGYYFVTYAADVLQGEYVTYQQDSCSVLVDFNSEQSSDIVVQDRGCPDPRKSNNAQCPCINPTGSGQCSTLPCFDPSQEDESRLRTCRQFPISTFAGCYCLGRFQQLINEEGAFSGSNTFTSEESDICSAWAQNYAAAQSLAVVAALSASLVNIGLSYLIEWLVQFERHSSVSSKSFALVWKSTVAQIFNTGLILLVVGMRTESTSGFARFLRAFGVLDGDVSDFTWQWYSEQGVVLTLTMTFEIFTPHLVPLVLWIKSVITRSCAVTDDTIRNFGVAETQAQVNRLYVGEEFNLAVRFPQMLSVLFVAFMYSPGLPLMAPIGFASFFITYLFDRWMLLRFYSKPPAYDTELATFALNMMPWALLTHILMAIFMLGNPEGMPSTVLPAAAAAAEASNEGEDLDSGSSAYFQYYMDNFDSIDGVGFIPRVVRTSTFPHFILFMIVLTGTVSIYVLWELVSYGLQACGLHALICGCTCCGGSTGGVAQAAGRKRKWVAPFTAPFGKALDELDPPTCQDAILRTQAEVDGIRRVHLAKIEIAQGWRVEDISGLPVLRKVMKMSREDLMKLRQSAKKVLDQQTAVGGVGDGELHTTSKVADKVLNTVLKETASAIKMAEAQYEDMDKGTPDVERVPKFGGGGKGGQGRKKKGGVRDQFKTKKGAKKLERLKLTWEVMQDNGLYSFDVRMHPRYRAAMMAKEGDIGMQEKARRRRKSRKSRASGELAKAAAAAAAELGVAAGPETPQG